MLFSTLHEASTVTTTTTTSTATATIPTAATTTIPNTIIYYLYNYCYKRYN